MNIRLRGLRDFFWEAYEALEIREERVLFVYTAWVC